MAAETLEFEDALVPLLKELDALCGAAAHRRAQPRDRFAHPQAAQRARRRSTRGSRRGSACWWRAIRAAPTCSTTCERLFTDFVELHGDRRFADDHAIVTGTACYKGEPVMVVGHHKGGDTKAKIYRNFGYARPEGYRKAMRLMRHGREIPPSHHRVRGHAGRLSRRRIRGARRRRSHRVQSSRDVRAEGAAIVVIVTGEGGSGGALGIAIGDSILMQEFAIYSVIPPEGCAAILWRDSQRKVEAAEALKLTAPDLLSAPHHRRDRPGARRRRAHEPGRVRRAARRPAAPRAGLGQHAGRRSTPRPPLREIPRDGPPGHRLHRR